MLYVKNKKHNIQLNMRGQGKGKYSNVLLSCKSPSTRSFDAIRDITAPHQWFACAYLLDP